MPFSWLDAKLFKQLFGVLVLFHINQLCRDFVLLLFSFDLLWQKLILFFDRVQKDAVKGLIDFAMLVFREGLIGFLVIRMIRIDPCQLLLRSSQ